MPHNLNRSLFLLILLMVSAGAQAQRLEWKAGVARVVITPTEPVWMAGYASRTRPAEGKVHDLSARALALEDRRGVRVVIVTTDHLGIPREMGEEIARRVARLHRLPRANLVLSSSHTHSGPVPLRRLEGAYFLDEAQQAAVVRTTEETIQKIVRAVGESLQQLAPAVLSFGRTEATFGMNRRVWRNNRYDFGANKEGVKDDDVPLLRVTTPDGRLRAVLFSYACHNTTLPIHLYQFNGDYAGYAEAELEAANPGVTAMFMMGCGADVGPQPTGRLEMAIDHGRALAGAIGQTIAAEMAPVHGRLRTRYELIPLPLNLLRREQLEAELQSKDRHRRAYAERWLRRWESGERVMTEYPYPLQVIQLGDGITLVAMSGEVVVDYVLRLKRELGSAGLWVTAYCNDVMAYIPSVRILNEGGYEPEYSMLYYDLPGYWHPSIEEKIIRKVHQMTRAVGREGQPAARHPATTSLPRAGSR